MSPIIARSMIRSRPLRLPLHPLGLRTYASARTATASSTYGSSQAWGAAWKKVGGSFMMYVPVVGVLMFWPAVTPPIVELIESIA